MKEVVLFTFINNSLLIVIQCNIIYYDNEPKHENKQENICHLQDSPWIL